MDISDALSLMLTFGMFLIALLTYIDRNNRQIKLPCDFGEPGQFL